MSLYESTFICTPDLTPEKTEETIGKIRKTIEHAGGSISLEQQLGRKKLAYPIGKFREGSYVYLELQGTGAMVTALENFYKVHDQVIRYLTIKVEKKKPVAVKPVASAEPQITAVEVPNADNNPPSGTK